MTHTPLDPKLLRSFLVLAEELHFGNAAARLHMTQPPLSKQIVQLEELLGVRLFDRNRRGVRLTLAGATLVTEAQRLFAQANLAVETVQRAARGDLARVRIAFNASVLFMDVEHLVTRVESALPGLQSTWEEMGSSEQTDALRQQRIDVGFAQAPQALQGLASREVARVPLAIALPARHRLARRRSISISALSDEDFVLVPRDIGPGFFDLVIAACVAAGFSPRIRHQARHLLTTLSLVATSGAVSLVPETLARASLPGITLRRIAGPKVEASYSVMWNPANTLPALPRVLDIFAARGADHRRRSRIQNAIDAPTEATP